MSKPLLQKLIITFLLLVGLFFVVGAMGWTQRIIGYAAYPLRPLSIRLAAAARAWGAFLQPSSETMDADTRDVAAAREEQQTFDSLHRQEELEVLLGFSQSRVREYYIAARVIGYSPLTQYAALIDRGTESGVAVGAAVIAHDGVLVGRVTEVRPGIAKFISLTDQDISIGVTFPGQEHVVSLLRSDAGGLLLTLIPQQAAVAKGTLIVTTNDDPRIPQGLIIGRLENFPDNRAALYQSATVVPLVPYRPLDYVLVYRPPVF